MATNVRSAVEAHLGARAEALLGFHSPKIAKERCIFPDPTSWIAFGQGPTGTFLSGGRALRAIVPGNEPERR
jgi:hypothetical protein